MRSLGLEGRRAQPSDRSSKPLSPGLQPPRQEQEVTGHGIYSSLLGQLWGPQDKHLLLPIGG